MDESASDISLLGHNFRVANGRLARRVRQQRARDELTVGQFSALGAIAHHGPLSLGELADHERVTAPSMNRTANSLVAAGLVARSAADNDGRKVILTASEKGAELIRRTRERRDAWITQRVAGLTSQQRLVLAEATLIMTEIADS